MQGLKPSCILRASMARLKSCPVTSRAVPTGLEAFGVVEDPTLKRGANERCACGAFVPARLEFRPFKAVASKLKSWRLKARRWLGTGATASVAGASLRLAGFAAALLAALPAAAQYPGQIANPNPNAPKLRAVAVLEWTGDLAHLHASRLIPICVWDGQQLQDGGIYLARPQPLALDSETEYELQKDGKNIGFYDLHDAAEAQGSWVGLGVFKPLPAAPKPWQLARERHQDKVDMDDADSDTPILHRKYHPDDAGKGSGNGNSGSSSGSSAGSGQPTLHRSADAGGNSTASNGSGSNGPTLHKSPDASGGSSAGSGSGDNDPSAPAPDPDRPRLTSDEDSASSAPANSGQPKLQNRNPGTDEAHVEDLPNISDPDRPHLRYGAPAEYGPSANPIVPTVLSLPPELKQDVAISDVQAIKEHPYDFTWSNPADEATMKTDLESMARKELGLDQPAPAAAKTKAQRTSTHHKTPPPPPAPLLDEQFRVFELQYGGGATMVFSAHTAGAGASEKFVTLIAQPDLYGNVVVLLKNVTDADHLDETPRMRLIDAVDALADNRGELLFELRGQSQRQFVLYRVLRGQATKIFTSSASYFGPAGGG